MQKIEAQTGIPSQQEKERAFSLDAGTTNGIFNSISEDEQGNYVIGEEIAYTTNQKRTDTITIIDHTNTERQISFCRWDENQYRANTLADQDPFASATVACHSGASSTALAVSDANTGEVKAMIYSKPPLHVPAPQEYMEQLSNLAEKSTDSLDPHYVWAKLDALRRLYPQLAPILGLPKHFEEIIVEPLIAATARTMNKLPFGIVGWGPDDWKGVTAGFEGCPERVVDAMKLHGFSQHQYTVQEKHTVIYERTPGQKVVVSTRGDFQVASLSIKEWLESVGEKGGKINREVDVVVECGTNFKFLYMGQNPKLLDSFPKQNGCGKYALMRNGAGVNPDIQFKIWAEEIVGNPFQFVDDQLQGHKLKPLYFYYPDWSEGHSLGELYYLNGSSIQEINLNSPQMMKHLEHKEQASMAVYAGLGCRAKKQIPFVQSLAMYSGFVNPQQQEKIRNFMEPFEDDVGCFGLSIPDSGFMTYVQEKKRPDRPVTIDPMVKRTHLRNGGGNNEYFQLWDRIGQAKGVFKRGRIA